jgi:hypothetical protein
MLPFFLERSTDAGIALGNFLMLHSNNNLFAEGGATFLALGNHARHCNASTEQIPAPKIAYSNSSRKGKVLFEFKKLTNLCGIRNL